MTFASEQRQKEHGERIQARLDEKIALLGHKPSPMELIEIVNNTLAELNGSTERYRYEMEEQ